MRQWCSDERPLPRPADPRNRVSDRRHVDPGRGADDRKERIPAFPGAEGAGAGAAGGRGGEVYRVTNLNASGPGSLADAVSRLVPGVLGGETSAELESHSKTGVLEHPHYTRPEEYRGLKVPEVLLSGNHSQIAKWRQENQK